jgi:predicted metal-binding membrane protein
LRVVKPTNKRAADHIASPVARHRPPPRRDAPAYAAARGRLGLTALLFGLAAVAWWFTVDRMRGMDQGPGTDLGTLAWFLAVWLVMMTAMMLPSVSPTVALYSRMTRTRAPLRPLVFTSGYLLVWGAAGLVAFGISDAGRSVDGNELSWGAAGHWLAGCVLVLAAAYELTPLKDACLGRCRTPLGYLVGSWRGGASGALRMGAGHGLWCVGCCWALMAALFALGVMNIGWMAFVAGLVALEKTLPWRRFATYGVAGTLLLLGLLLVFAPHAIPGLTIPGGPTDS